MTRLLLVPVLTSLLLLGGLSSWTSDAGAQTPPKPTKPAAKKPVAKKRAPPPLPEASQEQLEAAQLVYLGRHECEFDKTIDVAPDEKHPGYIGVKHGKASYLMKPVLSSTGAVRLEDVKGQTLLVQIASKSMLMNVRLGQRIADECVSPRQRELVEEAKRVQGAEAAASAAPAASEAASAADAAASAAPVAAEAASAAASAASR
ncbi:MAG TPA: hypothetical protein VGE16_05340 [Albitalea sp.]